MEEFVFVHLDKPKAEQVLIDEKLSTLISRRLAEYLYYVKGLVNDVKTWFLILIDSYKKLDFLEKLKSGSLKYSDFGTILATGPGDFPQEILDINALKLIKDDLIQLKLFKEGYDETFYVLCDPEKKLQILEATSAEEIQLHGKILYAGFGTEPHEILSLAIIKGIYNINSVEIDFTVRNRHVEAFWSLDLPKLEEYLNDDTNAIAVDHNGWNLLHYCALWGGQFPERQHLIFVLAGRKLNASAGDNWGRSPQHIAVKEYNFQVLNIFKRSGVVGNVRDDNGWTDMHYAAWKGSFFMSVKLLHSNYSSIWAKDKCTGKTPFLIASEEGHTEIVKLLLQEEPGNEEPGAGVSDCDDCGRTALHYAAAGGHVETARFLIGKKANIEAPKAGGAKPLHSAMLLDDNADMIKLLISHGAQIDCKEDKGQTPLHWAAVLGHLNNLQLLVEKGANVNAVDNEGKTPLDLAREDAREDVASNLSEKMAQGEGWGCSIS